MIHRRRFFPFRDDMDLALEWKDAAGRGLSATGTGSSKSGTHRPQFSLHQSLFGLSQPGRSCTDSTLSPCRLLSFFRCFWEPQIHMRYTSVTINGSGGCRTASDTLHAALPSRVL